MKGVKRSADLREVISHTHTRYAGTDVNVGDPAHTNTHTHTQTHSQETFCAYSSLKV